MPTKLQPHTVIILPTYNEADSIETLIEQILAITIQEKDYRFSLLIVDDNSPDDTAGIVKNIQKHHKNIHLLSGEKEGLGAAYVRGMRHATDRMDADILFEMDADLSHDPKLIPQFLRKLEEGADYVVGSRYITGGSIPSNWGIDRKVFSIIGNLVIRVGFMIPSIHEWTSGFRAMRVAVFKKISPGLEKYKGYIFQIASMYRVFQAHFVIAEVPINFIDRKFGESKIIPSQYVPDILSYIFVNSSFVRFVLTGIFGFGLDFSIAATLIGSFGFFEPTANAISAAVAVTSNFVINNYWSFGHKKITGGARNIARKYVEFVFVAIGSVFIQWAGMYVAIHTFGDGMLHALLISIPLWVVYKVLVITFLIIPYSYVMYNKVIWRRK